MIEKKYKTLLSPPLALALLTMPFITGNAANQTPATNYVQYACEESAHFFSVNSLDYRSENNPSTTEGLFLNATQKDKPEDALNITQCAVADQPLTLSRVFLNIPNNSGNLCATLDWGAFQIRAGETVVSEFISGCSFEIHVFTNQFNLHVCKSDFNETSCKTLAWQDLKDADFSPIRIGLLGNWL